VVAVFIVDAKRDSREMLKKNRLRLFRLPQEWEGIKRAVCSRMHFCCGCCYDSLYQGYS